MPLSALGVGTIRARMNATGMARSTGSARRVAQGHRSPVAPQEDVQERRPGAGLKISGGKGVRALTRAFLGRPPNDRRHRIGGFGLSLVVRAAQVLLATTMSVGAGAGSHVPRDPEKRARR